MKIILDAFGGDYAPTEIVKGALLGLYQNPELVIYLVGKQDVLEQELNGKKYDKERLIIVPASDVIEFDDSPVEAIRTKKDSSMVVAIDKLKQDPEILGLISAGSTGALLSGAVLKLGRIKGLNRPALAPLLPTATGGQVLLIDCGANMDTKPLNLVQFAVMVSVYMKKMLNIENPRIALLSVGTEDSKGNELVKESFKQLKSLPINFVGNMEARDALSGKYDIIVADGFAGNVLLKSIEGAFKLCMEQIKGAIKSSFFAKIGGLLIKKPLKKTLKRFDYHSFGGSPLLGTKRIVIKAHGSSKAKETLIAINQLIEIGSKNINKDIETALSEIQFGEQDEAN